MRYFIFTVFLSFSSVLFSQITPLDSVESSVIYAPNSFTPDNDVVNDGWRAECEKEWPEYLVQIFNSWGECIWVSNDMSEYWLGQSMKGGTHYSKDGIYIYRIFARDGVEVVEKAGYIYTIR